MVKKSPKRINKRLGDFFYFKHILNNEIYYIFVFFSCINYTLRL